MAIDNPLIVIVGPTASGKTALGIQLAKKLNGEIICADSRTVYKGLDIGTAKPSKQEQQEVPHHLLDVVDLDEYFSARDFKELANKAIDDILARGKLPILIGGTGLYIDSVIFNYSFAAKALTSKRDPINPRHLAKDVLVGRSELRPGTVVIGLEVDREQLRKRISARVNKMFDSGLIEEAIRIADRFDWDARPLQAPGYKAVRKIIENGSSRDEAKNEFIKSDMYLAKRQMTWFKRNKSIQWINDPSKAVEIVTTFLNKTN